MRNKIKHLWYSKNRKLEDLVEHLFSEIWQELWTISFIGGCLVTLRHSDLIVTADIKPVSDRVAFWLQAASKCTGLMWIPYNFL